MARLEALVMRRTLGVLARFTGPLMIVMISGSCGFVLGVTFASSPALP
ncbi:hypothetical protein [Streptomyces sp. NBC_01530]